MADLDTKWLRAAVVLADELNFCRAAQKLHIGQSTLTKRIKALEHAIGDALFNRDSRRVSLTNSRRWVDASQLFNRDSRRVSLTPAGEKFIPEARLALVHTERAIQLAREASRDYEVTLHIGKSPYTDPYLLSNLLSFRLPLFPNLRIKLCSKLSADLSHDLLNGTLDLAFLTGMPDTPRISSGPVSDQPFFVAMLEDDNLALNPKVNDNQLADRSCILFERHVHPTLYDVLCKAANPSTKAGTSIHHVMTAEDASQFVLRGLGVAVLTQAGAWRIARNGITIRPLCIDGLRLETRLACRSDNEGRVVSEFLRGFVRRLKERTNAKQLRLGLVH